MMKTPDSYQKPNGGSHSLDRMVRRLQLSEEVCRELRYLLTARVVDQDWSRICNMIYKWMKYAPKDVCYSRPPNNKEIKHGPEHNNEKQSSHMRVLRP